ncbi:MAG: alpha/beta hydrolase, partial [Bacteroidota bacterium]|nr:alpha/beta hydrolase [Bacteroidota bacterium]
ILQIIAVVLGGLTALMSLSLFMQFQWPAPAFWILKIYTSALSPLFALLGVLCTIAGLTTGSIFISLIGIYNMFVFSIHVFRITRPPASSSNFEKAFGANWKNRISSKQKNHFLQTRFLLRLPVVPDPRLEQNIPFATIPGTNQHLTTRSTPGQPQKKAPTQMPEWVKKSMGKDYYRLKFDKGFVNAGAFAPLMGGHPDERPDAYALFSPVSHVHSGCPPTLRIHGEHDLMAPAKTTHFLHSRLAEEKVPAVMHILPQTDHAFDLILPKINPSAHNAIYDVERFLALMVQTKQLKNRT